MSKIKWKIKKSDTKKNLVYGRFYTAKRAGKTVVDAVGDTISTEELERTAHEFLKDRRFLYRHGKKGKTEPVGELIESVVITPEKAEAIGLPATGDVYWWGGAKVTDPDTMAEIDTGHLKEFSIDGQARSRDKIPRPADAVVDPRAPKETYALAGLTLGEVSFVPKGKGSGVPIQITKEDEMDKKAEIAAKLPDDESRMMLAELIEELTHKAATDSGGESPEEKTAEDTSETKPEDTEVEKEEKEEKEMPGNAISKEDTGLEELRKLSQEAEAAAQRQIDQLRAELTAQKHSNELASAKVQVSKEFEGVGFDFDSLAELRLASTKVSKEDGAKIEISNKAINDVLDFMSQAKAIQDKSAVFSEFGQSGKGEAADPNETILKVSKEYLEENPHASRVEALVHARTKANQ